MGMALAVKEREVCLTGATGFIGGAIYRSLKNQFDVHIMTRQAISNNISTLQFPPCSDLIHAAARVHIMHEKIENPLEEYRKTNRDMTISLARRGLDSGIKRFIFISSLMVLGRSWSSKATINLIPRPDEPYGISKWEAEQELIEMFSGQTDAKCIILRLPMVYGPGNKGNMLPLLKAARMGIPLPLAGTRGKRSMVYVGNVCSAIETILRDSEGDHPVVETYVINDRNDLTSGELYTLIYQAFHGKKGIFSMPESLLRTGGNLGSLWERLTGKTLMLNKQNISRLFDAYSFSPDQFCRNYHWNPPYTPAEGIQRTVESYKEHHNEKIDSVRQSE